MGETIAGIEPKRIPVISESAKEKSSTRESIVISLRARSEFFHERNQRVDRDVCDSNPENSSKQREHRGFGNHLPQHSRSACADGSANRKLSLAGQLPRKAQVGDIRAGNQQHKSRGRK
jgi:hypothetical protein